MQVSNWQMIAKLRHWWQQADLNGAVTERTIPSPHDCAGKAAFVRLSQVLDVPSGRLPGFPSGA